MLIIIYMFHLPLNILCYRAGIYVKFSQGIINRVRHSVSWSLKVPLVALRLAYDHLFILLGFDCSGT